ncbi:hypothetical protein A9G24_07485 [Gilliamella sp. App6-5]|uniref:DUF5110 domain-containing protein n=1 Tax=Gilliamella sp. App6-5 TaxID=3120232 RepID=UPI00080E4126|nr:DUF5110 domain-containing protein [Gilliamella apicola]OCG13590.1 hypothetical protein A9G24_07485 [Gilliamella apicola]
MKQKITQLLIMLLVVPVVLVVILSTFAPFPSTEPMPLMRPKPLPKEGYQLFHSIARNGDLLDYSFYYVSKKRQVIYRYDADRYLELQGENCSGLIWYHDDKNNIHTLITSRFYTAYHLPKFNYYNPGKQYIAIPTNDLSDFVFSVDGGRHFIKAMVSPMAAVPGEEVDYFIGVDDSPIQAIYDSIVKSNEPISVSGNTGYFVLKNGEVIFGASHNYHDFDYENGLWNFQIFYPSAAFSDKRVRDGSRFGAYKKMLNSKEYQLRVNSIKNLKPEPYQGWDKIRCEVGAER